MTNILIQKKTPSPEDLSILVATEQARKVFDQNLETKFEPAIKELEELGYPGVTNPQITISSKVTTTEMLKHDSAVQYSLGAKIVENQFLGLLKKIFGEQAKYHTSVCEERGTKEHDIVVEFNNYILLIEAKASKVREPFFNPEKGYVRVKDHFNSDTGIGGAYEQAIILKQFIESKDSVVL